MISFLETLQNLVLKAIAKYCNYLILKTIEKIQKLNDLFSFANTSKNKAFQELLSLGSSKWYKSLDTPTKLLWKMLSLFKIFSTII